MSDWVTLKNMLDLQIRPIDAWPGPKKLRASWERERSPYSAPLKDTLRMLKTELNMLNATEIVLQAAFKEAQLRLDGLPRAGATAEHPGIILNFKTGKIARRRAFDKFTKWEYNLRALAFNLEHLRKANLYGVEEEEAQYAGWKAIGTGVPEGIDLGDHSPLTWAASIVAAAAVQDNFLLLIEDAEAFKAAYRTAAMRLHPDRGGSAEAFRRLQEAAELLRGKHGL